MVILYFCLITAEAFYRSKLQVLTWYEELAVHEENHERDLQSIIARKERRA